MVLTEKVYQEESKTEREKGLNMESRLDEAGRGK